MIEYGIRNSQAEYWIHVCPLVPPDPKHGCMPSTWLYRRERMIEAIESGRFKEADGFSGGENATGKGFLVPFAQPFIRLIFVPQHLYRGPLWHSLSDKDGGKAAEDLVWRIFELGYFGNLYQVRPFINRADQFAGRDAAISLLSEFSVEVKLDRRALQSGNLFVQTGELRHNHGHVRNYG